MIQTELLRLSHIVVEGLFDLYDHRIKLKLNDRVTLLHGPNGVGKTVILRMTDALLMENFAYFMTIPFKRLLLEFHDGTTIDLSSPRSAHQLDRYTLTLTRGDDTQTSQINPLAYRAESIASQIDYLHQHETLPRHWIDIRDGEVLSASEVLTRFSSTPPPPESHQEDDLTWFSTFLKNVKTHLIEAQRLVQINWDTMSRYPYFPMSRTPSMISTVVEYSKDFQKRLGETMAHYGRQSQTLDQSFPQRLITANDTLSVSDLLHEMTALDEKTASLKAIGILDETPVHPFPVASLKDIDPTNVRVMTLYVQDTAKKLQALDDLASRARLLLDNVNHKYRNKQLRLDRNEGFIAESANGQPLPLDSLSSGEQHELVLHYDLLFRVRSNTIVLVDEPELSLHVAWQKRFLPDLLQIVRVSDFDAMVATHSPYVIGDRRDLMVGLGGVD